MIDRAHVFITPGEVVDGNDPVASWHAIHRAMEYCRTQRRPYILEARVSRLYGHSSSSGALRVKNERDCLDILERRLRDAGILEQTEIDQIHADADAETEAALEQAS